MEKLVSKKTMKKEHVMALIVLILSSIACVFVVSYAFFNTAKLGNKVNQLRTGTLILTLDDASGSSINLTSAIPISDKEGLSSNGYSFKLKNIGTNGSKYRIRLINDKDYYLSDGCSENMLSWSNIKYAISKDGVTTTGILADSEGIIDEDILEVNKTNSYSLRLWIKASATNEIMGQHFHSKIQIEAIAAEKLN